MENEFFLNAGIPPPPMHFESTSSSLVPAWHSLSSAMDTAEQSPECFFNPNWERSSADHQGGGVHFDSALSSMVSSPAASNSNISNESFVIRELIGKLGNIGNSGEISPHSQQRLLGSGSGAAIGAVAAGSYVAAGNNSTNTSCYSTPLNSPPKLNLPPIMDHEDLPSLGKSRPLNSTVAEFSADPGFAERAARFSCFGSRSFNGRTTQLGMKNTDQFPYINNNRSNPLMGNGKLPRVSSSPSLKALATQLQNKNSPLTHELANSQEESTVSEQNPVGENGLKPPPNEPNSRKRKAVSKGKGKESSAPNKGPEAGEENSNAKRCKPTEGNAKENGGAVKAEEEQKGDEKQNNNQKPPEPPKDYIHVRARRGQATDSHSLAERVRREKISERMKLLQDLVPGCNKVTGKALMLDEIINYVQSLQRQVEFLSMKLSSVNTRLDFNMDSLMSKDIFQSNNSSVPQPIFPLDSSASAFFGHQPQQNATIHGNISNGTVTQCSVDPIDSALCRSLGVQLPQLDGFGEGASQYPTFCEDDLQSIVQMGFGQNPSRDTHNVHGSNQVSQMKIEL